jgi:hypothetical protein
MQLVLECIMLAGAALRWHVQEMQTGFAHGRAELVTGDSFRASAALHAENLNTSGGMYCITYRCTVKPRHVHQLGSSLPRPFDLIPGRNWLQSTPNEAAIIT